MRGRTAINLKARLSVLTIEANRLTSRSFQFTPLTKDIANNSF